jgi:hypothetical protein
MAQDLDFQVVAARNYPRGIYIWPLRETFRSSTTKTLLIYVGSTGVNAKSLRDGPDLSDVSQHIRVGDRKALI